jgi:tetratricopeptide (TPR) repeat protein
MKTRFLIIALILSLQTNVFAQTDYFLGKRTYCEMPTDSETKKLFKLGIDCINLNLRIGAANRIFQDLIKKDKTFCDAYFFAGYTFRLSNMNKEAVVMYYIADSLSQNKSIEFKQNLAFTSIMVGKVDLARKKFKEITTFFPENPEGYYGIALTSTIIGDFDNGLENINIAEKKYTGENKDAQFLKAILLTLNKKHLESLQYYGKVQSNFSKDDNFNGNYALSLYEVGIATNDEKMLKKAKKHYGKVKDKSELAEDIKFKFEKK